MRHLRQALRNPAIRRVVLAFSTFNFAEWATWTAILVYAYQRGGATESGLIAFAMVAPAAVLAPIIATIGGRLRRERMLLVAYVVQAIVMVACAAALFAEAPAAVVYVLATLTSISVTFTRPAHGAILPSLASDARRADRGERRLGDGHEYRDRLCSDRLGADPGRPGRRRRVPGLGRGRDARRRAGRDREDGAGRRRGGTRRESATSWMGCRCSPASAVRGPSSSCSVPRPRSRARWTCS